ncbi:MAG: alpha/beta hydrolase [Devosiaceae bacterium]|nr:alpha/beta hydrolase [Devosiaceae bacterium]
MPQFISENIKIAYEDYGKGEPIILIHGFASNAKVNWLDTGWVDILVNAGYRVITIDNRGHGQSEKLYDSKYYPAKIMAHDTINLIDHLELSSAFLLGYSMGARISAFVAMQAPQKVRGIVFGGMGINLIRGMRDSSEIIAGLRADSLEEIEHKAARQFRVFAQHTKSDLKALAYCLSSSRDPITKEDVEKIDIPALVVVGSDDTIGGSPSDLANILPQGKSLLLEGVDHMRSTGDKRFKQGVIDFLDENSI